MKKRLKGGVSAFLAVLLTAAILLGMTACGQSSSKDEKKEQSAAGTAIPDGVYQGTFRFTDIEDKFYYDDAYFNAPGDKVNEHLRTLSVILSLSAEGSNTEHTVDLMTQIGMDEQSIVAEEMVQGTPDTIGSIIGHKQFGDGALVAMAIRGKEYEGEWASNMLAGKSGDATGMEAPAKKLSERLKRYLEDNQIKNAKIWIAGYSRAGGAADLLGRYINEDLSAYHTTKDDIYVYTFEAPRCSADQKVYPNIHNVTDVNDAVVYMFPEGWGLYLNGVTEKIGDPTETLMTKYFDPGKENYISDYQERTKSLFMEQFEAFVGTASTRELYAASTEQYVSSLVKLYFSKNLVDRESIVSYLKKTGELIKEDPSLNVVLLSVFLDPTSSTSVNQVSDLVLRALASARASENPPITDPEYKEVEDSVVPIVSLLLTLADVDIDYTETDEQGKTVNLELFHIVTILVNMKELLAPHYSGALFDVVKKADSYYTDDPAAAVIEENDESQEPAVTDNAPAYIPNIRFRQIGDLLQSSLLSDAVKDRIVAFCTDHIGTALEALIKKTGSRTAAG